MWLASMRRHRFSCGPTNRCSGRGCAAGQLAGLIRKRLGWQPFGSIIAAPLSSTVSQPA